MNEKIMKILRYAVIAIFVSYYAESTLFFHSHTFEWGTVTHSHPYMPGSAHSHSSSECETIHSLNNILFTIVAAVAVFVTVVECCTLYSRPLQSVTNHITVNCSLRAPPVSLINQRG